jgi:hypothetical protein
MFVCFFPNFRNNLFFVDQVKSSKCCVFKLSRWNVKQSRNKYDPSSKLEIILNKRYVCQTVEIKKEHAYLHLVGLCLVSVPEDDRV